MKDLISEGEIYLLRFVFFNSVKFFKNVYNLYMLIIILSALHNYIIETDITLLAVYKAYQ